MPLPKLLPIKRMDDLHTALIGRCAKGQFMIIETLPISDCEEFLTNPAKYVVEYLFLPTGELLSTRHTRFPKNALQEAVEKEKSRLLEELKPFKFCDIVVKPFKVMINGVYLGLVYSEETDSVNLEPGPLITFMAPWDGEYYT